MSSTPVRVRVILTFLGAMLLVFGGVRAQTPVHLNLMVWGLYRMQPPPASPIDAFSKAKCTETGCTVHDLFDPILKRMDSVLKVLKRPFNLKKVPRDSSQMDDFSKKLRNSTLEDARKALDALNQFHSVSDSCFKDFATKQPTMPRKVELTAAKFAVGDYDMLWDVDLRQLEAIWKELYNDLVQLHYGDGIVWEHPQEDWTLLATAERKLVENIVDISKSCQKMWELSAKIYNETGGE